ARHTPGPERPGPGRTALHHRSDGSPHHRAVPLAPVSGRERAGDAASSPMSRVEARKVVSVARLQEWVSPPRRLQVEARCHAEAGEVATSILAVLLASRFRKGSLDGMARDEFVANHTALIADRVRRGQPVQLTLIGFPFK